MMRQLQLPTTRIRRAVPLPRRWTSLSILYDDMTTISHPLVSITTVEIDTNIQLSPLTEWVVMLLLLLLLDSL